MQRRDIRVCAWLAGFALMCASAQARAAMTCSVVSTSGVSFGAYDTFRAAPVDSAGSIAFRCTDVGPADSLMIQLSRGDSGSFLPRAMVHHGYRLEYNLYLDAPRTVVWGDGTAGTSAYITHPLDGQSVSVPIFGRIPARQAVRPDSYGDVIVVTVLY